MWTGYVPLPVRLMVLLSAWFGQLAALSGMDRAALLGCADPQDTGLVKGKKT